MKEAVSSFDLIAVVSELQELVGGHLDKVYQDGDEFYLRINTPGGGHREVYIKPGKWLCLRDKEGAPESLPPFATALRRHLSNASITAITQRGFDRVVVFGLRTERTSDMIVELFGGGNIILVEDGKTILCQRKQVLKSRHIEVGQKYDFPPAGTNPLDLDRAAFHAQVKAGKGAIARTLATELNLGGLYAEEICLAAGVDKKGKASSLSEEQLDGLFTALNNLIVAVQEDRRPAVVMNEDGAIDAVPIDLKTYGENERVQCATFSEALSKFLEAANKITKEKEVTPQEEITAKYRRRIEQQEESIRTLGLEAKKNELLALFLFDHFQDFEELLKTVREGREPGGNRTFSVDHEKRTVTAAIGESDSIELDYRKDVNGNAQILYAKRRDAQERAARVEAALNETRGEMERAMRRAKRVTQVARREPTKQFWFETYRWFVSSEGFLVIAGRDARSNESLVRKHMKDGDRYAHADTHGAPSVVVKEGSRAGEQTLKEACEFALAYSKAWSSKLAAGSAYWVKPEQVSKSAESGEYVPKGAFIIRGKRNYFKDLQVRAAVGEIEHEGSRKAMAGPVSAVTANSKRYVLLEPGEMSKESVANRLARALNVPSEEVSRILPPGPLRIAEATGIDIA